jgi:hypothetical protein
VPDTSNGQPPAPVRMQLSRAKGFDLQLASIDLNGLPAMNCARPGPWGNRWRVGWISCGCDTMPACPHNAFRCDTAQEAVEAHATEVSMWTPGQRRKAIDALRGHNLACWCSLDQPFCHGNTLLKAVAA